MIATHFLTFDSAGHYTGSGYTPDGTLPEDAVVCTEAEAQAAGPWTRVIEGELIVGQAPAPPPSQPEEVSNFQVRALLMGMPGAAVGRSLFQDVDDALRQEGGVAWQAWEYTYTIPRNSALVAALAAQFNLNAAALDEMFRAAAQITI